MPEQFLYQSLDAFSQFGGLRKEMPDSVKLHLNPKYELRGYQIEAFARFFHCHKNDFPNKSFPLHFLFNMATGSGKTLIMAGLILYLHEQGYRNFLPSLIPPTSSKRLRLTSSTPPPSNIFTSARSVCRRYRRPSRRCDLRAQSPIG